MFAIDGDYVTPCHDTEPTKELCGTCRIQLICLHKALEYEALSGERLNGVRGGLTEAERANTTLNRVS